MNPGETNPSPLVLAADQVLNASDHCFLETLTMCEGLDALEAAMVALGHRRTDDPTVQEAADKLKS